MNHKRMPARDCLRCHGKLDAATCLNANAAPKAGDVTMCFYCGHMMAFTDGLALRELNDEERAWCAQNALVQAAKAAREDAEPTHPDRKTLQ